MGLYRRRIYYSIVQRAGIPQLRLATFTEGIVRGKFQILKLALDRLGKI
jgi:hypothetical protein